MGYFDPNNPLSAALMQQGFGGFNQQPSPGMLQAFSGKGTGYGPQGMGTVSQDPPGLGVQQMPQISAKMPGVPQYDPWSSSLQGQSLSSFGGMPQGAQSNNAPTPGMFASNPLAPPAAAPADHDRHIDIARLGAMILAANNNPLGTATLQQLHDDADQSDEATRQQLARQQALTDRWNMFQREHQWERNNPAPTNLDRYMTGAGIDPHSPQGVDLYRQAATNAALGPVTMGTQYDPATGNMIPVPMRGGMPYGTTAPHVMTDEEMRAYQGQGGPSGSPPRAGFPK